MQLRALISKILLPRTSLIQKEFEPVGTVARCKIEVVHYKDLINGNNLTASRLMAPKPFLKLKNDKMLIGYGSLNSSAETLDFS
jgi:hypothetical protein